MVQKVFRSSYMRNVKILIFGDIFFFFHVKENFIHEVASQHLQIEKDILDPNLIRNKCILYSELINDMWLYFLYQCLRIFHIRDQHEKYATT